MKNCLYKALHKTMNQSHRRNQELTWGQSANSCQTELEGLSDFTCKNPTVMSRLKP